MRIKKTFEIMEFKYRINKKIKILEFNQRIIKIMKKKQNSMKE